MAEHDKKHDPKDHPHAAPVETADAGEPEPPPPPPPPTDPGGGVLEGGKGPEG